MPGNISLIGSGETATIGGQIFEASARRQGNLLSVSILETPAGFETNASRVASRVAAFIEKRLSSYHPKVHQIAARHIDSPYSPNAPEVVAPLYASNLIFFGPGSPTYTVRQLRGSLAWDILQARHRLGTDLVLASAATIAIGALALPVYEIFKVGEDPRWKPGLDLLAPFGLPLVIIPHWNNREGGEDVDTSRCFIGEERFRRLLEQIPPAMTVVGIDEHTALTIDFEQKICRISGIGEVHLIRAGGVQHCAAGCEFPITDLGAYHPLAALGESITPAVWQQAQAETYRTTILEPVVNIPAAVQSLVEAREAARRSKDWPRADQLRQEIQAHGWQVMDSPQGPVISQLLAPL